jgi:3-hydroxyisobutyrate dehydrogenase
MGEGMARSLLRAGHQVTVWNRTSQRAQPLAADGAVVASTPAEAVTGAEVVLTVLFDEDAVREVLDEAVGALDPAAVWVQASTIGVEGTARAADFATKHGVSFVDAPVLGTRGPAAQGKLTVLASGDPALRERVQPVFEAIGARTVWAGDRPGPASELKLVANAYVASLNAALGQSVALAGALGLDPALFLEAIGGSAVDSPYVKLKGGAMVTGEYTDAQFTVAGVGKDVGLIRDAAQPGISTVLLDAVAQVYREVEQAGGGDHDMAAVVTGYRPADS